MKCHCCKQPITGKPYVVYEMAAPIRCICDDLDYDDINVGTTYQLCGPCSVHRGVVKVSLRRGPITPKTICAELANQERTPTVDGFFAALSDRFTLYVATECLKTVENFFTGPDYAKEKYPLDFTITVAAINHFHPREWVLVPKQYESL